MDGFYIRLVLNMLKSRTMKNKNCKRNNLKIMFSLAANLHPPVPTVRVFWVEYLVATATYGRNC